MSRELDEKLTNDILKLVNKHSNKSGKVLTMMRLKHKEHVGAKTPFELTNLELRWRFKKDVKKGK